MNRKVFTFLLLAVFVLAQFSVASAAALAGTATITALPAFSSNTGNAKIDWSVTGMPGAAAQYINVWSRIQATPANPWSGCQVAGTANTFTSAVGSFNYSLAGFADQDVVEFYIAVDDTAACGGAVPATSKAALTSTFIDANPVGGLVAVPPSLSTAAAGLKPVSCNTFEMWSIVKDNYNYTIDEGYSGLASWKQLTTGTYAPPVAAGPADELLSWVTTLPATASGPWSFSINPTDFAGNAAGVSYFRNGLTIAAPELEDCTNFTDTAGHADEVYIRYLADLGIISGNPDGSFNPDGTLTRAEASALFEKANGYDVATLPTTPSAACTFSDVAATDWFAGWVWQACADGFMNGLGGGKFGPADLLTRGQIVTIFNNIHVAASGTPGSFLDDGATIRTVLNFLWNNWWTSPQLREAAWTDVPVGAFYAGPVQYAYAVGVAEGTSATTFSPDQPTTRGEYIKMLYRALSRI